MADTYNLGLGSNNPYLGKDNPYLQSIIDSTTGDLVKNWNTATLPAFNRAMIQSGSFGNSGVDQMTQQGADQLQSNIAKAAAQLRFGDYTQQQQMFQWDRGLTEQQRQFDEGTRRYEQDFGRGVYNDAFGQQQQQLQNSLGLIGLMGSYGQQDLALATQQQNTPLNYFQQFAQTANALGGRGGSTTATQGTSSNPVTSALGGAQLGNSIQNWWNQPSSTPNQNWYSSAASNWGTSNQ